jgi:RNA polymerase sigma factor (sigma-70 family)
MRKDRENGPALLVQFANTRDEDAFRSLVRIYAPLVWDVCQRCLPDPNDAEDAFQATFIVLARKAERVLPPERVSSWLHGVALRAAKDVRRRAVRRRDAEAAAVPAAPYEAELPNSDLRQVFDEELTQLPVALRQAFVLCRVEGRTYPQAAQLLGCAARTVGDRVARATEILKSRLGRRGLAPAGSLVGIAPAFGNMADPLLERVVSGALGSAGSAASAGPVVAMAVANSVIRRMALLWYVCVAAAATTVLFSVGVATAVVANRGQTNLADSPAKQAPVASAVQSIDDGVPPAGVQKPKADPPVPHRSRHRSVPMIRSTYDLDHYADPPPARLDGSLVAQGDSPRP